MMAAVFATMSLALLVGRYGPKWLAVLSLMACLGLSIWLFLFEIYSPDYGFRMPWLQSMLESGPRPPSSGDMT